MSYATNTDLLVEFKGLSGWNSSTVSSTTVDTWCDKASAFIDAQIGGKYQVPVVSASSPQAFKVLAEICVWLVKERVQGVLKFQTGAPKTSVRGSENTDWRAVALNTLKQIRTGEIKLVDAPLATSQDAVESYTNDNSDTLQPPQFTRESDDW